MIFCWLSWEQERRNGKAVSRKIKVIVIFMGLPSANFFFYHKKFGGFTLDKKLVGRGFFRCYGDIEISRIEISVTYDGIIDQESHNHEM